jgi:hypothetical protein
VSRKRKSSEGGISLDSLMDALTNVVAVLILVLILVQADVTRKVQKFLDDLQPATPEEIVQSKKLLDDLERKQRLVEARLLEKPASLEDVEEEKRQIALLEKSLQENKEHLADINQVKALESKVRAERDAESAQTVAIQKEISRLEGLLDSSPPVQVDAPTVVNIPNSRPIPENAKAYHAMAFQNRIHIIDPHTPLTLFNREFEKRKGDWIVERKKIKGKPDRFVYDGTKIVAHFQNFNWGNSRGQTVHIQPEPTNYFLWLVIRPNLGSGGTSLEDIARPDSEFVKSLPVIRQSFQSILLYRVHINSFPAYLAARELSDKANIPAGWEIRYDMDFRMPIPDVTVKRLKEPPPKTDTPKPAGPQKLKPRLD